MSDKSKVMRAVYYVEVGACDENLAGEVRQALARKLRQTTGDNTHVQVTMDVACADSFDDLATVKHAAPEPEHVPQPSEADLVVAAFQARSKYRQGLR